MVKRTSILMAAAVLALSCSKTEAPAPEGRPLTVVATIGAEDTKTTYTPEGNIMKVGHRLLEKLGTFIYLKTI